MTRRLARGTWPPGRRVVFTNGVFDILHPGTCLSRRSPRHATPYRGREFGPIGARQQGPERPVHPEAERARSSRPWRRRCRSRLDEDTPHAIIRPSADVSSRAPTGPPTKSSAATSSRPAAASSSAFPSKRHSTTGVSELRQQTEASLIQGKQHHRQRRGQSRNWHPGRNRTTGMTICSGGPRMHRGKELAKHYVLKVNTPSRAALAATPSRQPFGFVRANHGCVEARRARRIQAASCACAAHNAVPSRLVRALHLTASAQARLR